MVKAVARIISLALDLGSDFFDRPEVLSDPIAILRLLHYEGETNHKGCTPLIWTWRDVTFVMLTALHFFRSSLWAHEGNIWSWCSYWFWFNHPLEYRWCSRFTSIHWSSTQITWTFYFLRIFVTFWNFFPPRYARIRMLNHRCGNM